MTSRDFVIPISDYNKKKKTIIQHKIRTLLKCYTVQEFNLNESDCSFSFKKTLRINGLQMTYPTTLYGKYSIEDLGLKDNTHSVKLTLSV